MVARPAFPTIAALVLAAGVLPRPSAAAVEEIVSGLDQPVRLVAPAGDDRLFVVERVGRIRIFDQQGLELATFLDIRDSTTIAGERGLLGLAFPPDYAATGRFYVDYTDDAGDTRIVRLRADPADPDRADPASHEILLTVPQPHSNHNGGHLEFGPDGMLYVGMGDGGGFGDPDHLAQDGQRLLGKMLRLDVGVPAGYAVPGGNPFTGQPPRDEIWALGLRNPWCFSFDGLTGDLYIADVGESDAEEIDVQPASSAGGENYGWSLMEGNLCFDPPADCDDGSLTLPVHTYSHGGTPWRCAVSGGYVYRGSRIPSLYGDYFFADYCSNQIWTLAWSPTGGAGAVVDRTADMTPPGGYGSICSFGRDGLGELYVVDLDGGAIYRIVGAASDAPEVPVGPFLAQNAPNPFNPSTTIAYEVPAGSSRVSLKVYDAAGRLVRTLVDGSLSAGEHRAEWDGTGDDGRRVPSGVYLYRLVVDGQAAGRRMVLLE